MLKIYSIIIYTMSRHFLSIERYLYVQLQKPLA